MDIGHREIIRWHLKSINRQLSEHRISHYFEYNGEFILTPRAEVMQMQFNPMKVYGGEPTCRVTHQEPSQEVQISEMNISSLIVKLTPLGNRKAIVIDPAERCSTNMVFDNVIL